MNILLYVITVIMLLTITTYLRLENLISTYAVKKEFTRYLKNESKDQIEDAAEDWYNQVNFARGSSKNENNQGKSKASRKISWFSLLHPELTPSNGTNELILQLSKVLIYQLFQEDRDFQEMHKKDPHIVDSLMTRIVESTRQLSQEKKITCEEDLCTLELNDPRLNQLLYLLIQGYHKPSQKPIGQEESEEAEEPLKSQERHRVSLLNFITFKNSDKIRVYLASRPLLQAIYGDEALVENIVEARYELYRRALSEENTLPLQAEFERFKQGPYAALLDFTISKTNPRSYE